MLRLYIIGVCILVIAITANIMVVKIGLTTWYDFGHHFLKRGFKAITDIDFFSLIWLFILYPIVLSLGYIIGDRICKLF